MLLWVLLDHTKTVLYFSIHHFQTRMKFVKLDICYCLFLFEKQAILLQSIVPVALSSV